MTPPKNPQNKNHTQSGHAAQCSAVPCYATMKHQIKGYPFEVITLVGDVPNVVLADQIKSLNWRVRKAKFKCKINPSDLNEIKAKLKPLLQLI